MSSQNKRARQLAESRKFADARRQRRAGRNLKQSRKANREAQELLDQQAQILETAKRAERLRVALEKQQKYQESLQQEEKRLRQFLEPRKQPQQSVPVVVPRPVSGEPAPVDLKRPDSQMLSMPHKRPSNRAQFGKRQTRPSH